MQVEGLARFDKAITPWDAVVTEPMEVGHAGKEESHKVSITYSIVKRLPNITIFWIFVHCFIKSPVNKLVEENPADASGEGQVAAGHVGHADKSQHEF